MKRSLLYLAGSAILAVGCSGEKAAPPQQAAASASSEFGVPECDAYVKKYLACLESVPEPARAAARQGFDQSREGWKRLAATPEGRTGLVTACQQAESASKVGMQAYGCKW